MSMLRELFEEYAQGAIDAGYSAAYVRETMEAVALSLPTEPEPRYVACEECGHEHYDIVNNWFTICSICQKGNGCPKDQDPDRGRRQPA